MTTKQIKCQHVEITNEHGMDGFGTKITLDGENPPVHGLGHEKAIQVDAEQVGPISITIECQNGTLKVVTKTLTVVCGAVKIQCPGPDITDVSFADKELWHHSPHMTERIKGFTLALAVDQSPILKITVDTTK